MLAFAEPLALLFAALYGVLALYHLRERRRRVVVVPSLLLWRDVPPDRLHTGRLRLDPLFVLQAAALGALVLGLAGPYLRALPGAPPRARQILVLDTTASMQSREGRQTRFEAARAAAAARLAALPPDTEVMLIAADRSPRVVADFTRDHDAVRAALLAVPPTDTGGDLTVALAVAEAARQRTDLPTAIDVFTDLPAGRVPAAVRDGVTVHQFGETDLNLAITGVTVHQGRFEAPGAAQVGVQVENFAHTDGHGVLAVSVGDAPVGRTGFSIPARSSRSFLFGGIPGGGPVMARLETNDALASDNVAFGWVATPRPVRVLVVSPPGPLAADLRALAAAVPGMTVTAVEPAALTPAVAGGADVLVLHRLPADDPPPANALYVFPDAASRLFPATGEAEDVEVLDWDDAHPALRDLRPVPVLPLRRTRVVTPPAWLRPIVWSRTGSGGEFGLVLAGERNGQRVACFTFDLEGERALGADRQPVLLLLASVLGWLAPPAEAAVVGRTGDPVLLGPFPAGTVRVEGPPGTPPTVTGPEVIFEPVRAGAYHFRGDGVTRLLLAHLADPVESDIGRGMRGDEPPLPVSAGPSAAPAAAHRSRRPPVPGSRAVLYAAALLLLAMEWVVWTRRSP